MRLLLIISFLDSFTEGALGEDVLFPIIQGGKWGFIDAAGTVVIEPAFDGVSTLLGRNSYGYSGLRYPAHFAASTGGLEAVEVDGKYGYIDIRGKFVIEPKFDVASRFSAGLAAVRIGDNTAKYGFIDKRGKYIVGKKFDSAEVFADGFALVRIGDEHSFIDKTGAKLADRVFANSTRSFSEGLASVEDPKSGLFGYIDSRGIDVVPPQFRSTMPFSDGRAVVSNSKGRYGYVDKSGKLVIEFRYDYDGVEAFCDGLAAVKADEKWGFIDKEGQTKIRPQFDGATFFRDGWAVVSIGKKEGVINKQGEFVLKPEFDRASAECVNDCETTLIRN